MKSNICGIKYKLLSTFVWSLVDSEFEPTLADFESPYCSGGLEVGTEAILFIWLRAHVLYSVLFVC